MRIDAAMFASRHSPPSLLLRSAPARFAAGVVARVGARTAPAHAPRLARVYQRNARVLASREGGHFTFAPRIDVRFATFGRRTHEPALAVARMLPVAARVVARPVSATVTQDLVERSRARAARDDGGSTRARRTMAVHVDGGGAEPMPREATRPAVVARVLKRRLPVVADPAAPATSPEWGARTASPPRAPQLTAVDVSRLTDHIVHTIDRRIAAFRERQGRI
jgi:hypothetical protein